MYISAGPLRGVRLGEARSIVPCSEWSYVLCDVLNMRLVSQTCDLLMSISHLGCLLYGLGASLYRLFGRYLPVWGHFTWVL